MATYELLRGSHSDADATLVSRCRRGDVRQVVDKLSNELIAPVEGSFEPGDIFSTEKNMLRFNPNLSPRFALISA